MKKCPYCFEEITEDNPAKCLHCFQFIIDPLVESDYRSIDKKNCIFCGKKILKEARVCKYCHKWIDEMNRTVDDIEKVD